MAYTIWTPLGGFKRGTGLIALLVLVYAAITQTPLGGQLEAMLTAIVGTSLVGNIIASKSEAETAAAPQPERAWQTTGTDTKVL